MKNSRRFFELFAGLSGFCGVLTGAIAAHKAQDLYAENLLRLASLYQLVHSVAILAMAARTEKAARIGCLFFASGIVLFCGGLCAKALLGVSVIETVIPFGGACLMLGWLSLTGLAFRRRD